MDLWEQIKEGIGLKSWSKGHPDSEQMPNFLYSPFSQNSETSMAVGGRPAKVVEKKAARPLVLL